MPFSSIALRAADIAPAAVRPFVRLWSYRYLQHPDRQHWLFRRLRSRLGVRVHRRFQLHTGQQILIDPLDSVGAEIYQHGCYEPETVALLSALLGPGMVYVDVGAYIGHHALIAAARVGHEGAVHAFEPAPITYAELQRNVALNECRNVHCNNVALGDRPGSAIFYLADLYEAANSLGRTVHAGGGTINVVVSTLDDYFLTGPTRLDVIKVDVEGAELLFLRGAHHTIQRYRPALILEFSQHTAAFGYTCADLATALRALGYELFLVAKMPLEHEPDVASTELYYNVLAVHASKVHDLAARHIIASTRGAPEQGE